MNAKLNPINPAVTHGVQPFGFIKVAALAGLFTTGVIAFAYNPDAAEYRPPVTIPAIAPSNYEVQTLKLDSDHSGTGLIRLDDFILKVGFDFEQYPVDYGVPSAKNIEIEVSNLAIDDVKSIYGAEFNDFTVDADHRAINQLIAGYIMRNKLVEAI
ncbi:hypothetical protein EXE10_18950 [Acinetobacter sp. WCHAc060033]|uniref:hypothetical protein n=1 Tax=Acinetobacter sp. WCHAc060033 TaxID=2518624 RepID=UPI0010237636|nr:hypothetical protein [Acinetobacter sp. WCHAc060033]RZG77617.1 hypothetical protein EXE10_18950 [Acinetobacter sp. WCHAc060033]